MMQTYLKRDCYLQRIKGFINKELIKVIVGQRRVGKSMFLFEIMDFLKDQKVKQENILYIDKEDNAFDLIKNGNDLILYVEKFFKKLQDKKYLFIDEIQEIEYFEKAIRSLNKKGFDIYCTGSNSDLLSSDIASILTGRYIEIEIYSLSYKEFLEFHNLINSNESFLKYVQYGGLPFLRNLELNDVLVRDYLKSVYSTILLKDIVRRYNVRNIKFLENLCLYIADNIGNIFSANKIIDFLKAKKINLSPHTVLNYISNILSTFLIFEASRVDV